MYTYTLKKYFVVTHKVYDSFVPVLMRRMRIMNAVGLLLVSLVDSSGVQDACARLCLHDGPHICTGGSWTKANGYCQAYLFLGDPLNGNYCYHSTFTAVSCPSKGAVPVKPSDVERLLQPSTTTSTIARDEEEFEAPPVRVRTTLREAIALMQGTAREDLELDNRNCRLFGWTEWETAHWFSTAAAEITIEKIGTATSWEELKAIGRFLALALAKNCLVPIQLPMAAWARLTGKALLLSDIESMNPDLHASLSRAIARHRLTLQGANLLVAQTLDALLLAQEKQALFVVREGFQELNPNPARLQSAEMLRSHLVGSDFVNVDSLMVDWDISVPVVGWLADIVSGFSQDELRKFVHLVTGSPQMPVDTTGFQIWIQCEESEIVPLVPNTFPGFGIKTLVLGPYTSRSHLAHHLSLYMATV